MQISHTKLLVYYAIAVLIVFWTARRVLIASIMEEYSKGAWEEIVGRCEDVGVDGFEINFSCPHGMPERRMGMAMGQDPDILSEVCASSSPLFAPHLSPFQQISDLELERCLMWCLVSCCACVSAQLRNHPCHTSS